MTIVLGTIYTVIPTLLIYESSPQFGLTPFPPHSSWFTPNNLDDLDIVIHPRNTLSIIASWPLHLLLDRNQRVCTRFLLIFLENIVAGDLYLFLEKKNDLWHKKSKP